mmetsp:Transcript_26086/g.58798  ORF Transcript_26086/g.58798 Transcript_26086/m.58798 type:complete len:225 (+) Transcript_26086:294-968(+)
MSKNERTRTPPPPPPRYSRYNSDPAASRRRVSRVDAAANRDDDVNNRVTSRRRSLPAAGKNEYSFDCGQTAPTADAILTKSLTEENEQHPCDRGREDLFASYCNRVMGSISYPGCDGHEYGPDHDHEELFEGGETDSDDSDSDSDHDARTKVEVKKSRRPLEPEPRAPVPRHLQETPSKSPYNGDESDEIIRNIEHLYKELDSLEASKQLLIYLHKRSKSTGKL